MKPQSMNVGDRVFSIWNYKKHRTIPPVAHHHGTITAIIPAGVGPTRYEVTFDTYDIPVPGLPRTYDFHSDEIEAIARAEEAG